MTDTLNPRRISDAELLVNPDGSIYHLNLKPEELAHTIITVGDPGRVKEVTQHFDYIQHEARHREFLSQTGYLNNKRLTVISTGIGTDNIDIVLSELDALANIDFETRTVKPEITSLNIIRLGTSGSVLPEIKLGDIVISESAIGLDSLLHYYPHQNSIQETVYLEAFKSYIQPYLSHTTPYIASASEDLVQRFERFYRKATTLTACGFYAPQGRMLRMEPELPDFLSVVQGFKHKHFSIGNIEMETAGIYGLGKLFGHHCLSLNVIVVNRTTGEFAKYHEDLIQKMITEALEVITIEVV